MPHAIAWPKAAPVSDVPEIAGFADVSAISFRQAASGELGVGDLAELAAEIEGWIDDGAAGAVKAEAGEVADVADL